MNPQWPGIASLPRWREMGISRHSQVKRSTCGLQAAEPRRRQHVAEARVKPEGPEGLAGQPTTAAHSSLRGSPQVSGLGGFHSRSSQLSAGLSPGLRSGRLSLLKPLVRVLSHSASSWALVGLSVSGATGTCVVPCLCCWHWHRTPMWSHRKVPVTPH